MLRISVMNSSGTTQLKLEGKLAHEWVHEARKTWDVLKTSNCDGEVIVDLMDVCFVDRSGHQLLVEMRRAGAELVGHGPLMSALIEEIEEAEATGEDRSGES